MRKEFRIRYGNVRIPVSIPTENFLFFIEPENVSPLYNEQGAIRDSLNNPISCPPLSEQV